MRKIQPFVLLLLMVFSTSKAQEIFTTQNGKVSFHSETSLQNIDAISNKMVAAINNKTKQVYFKIQNTSFRFDEKLMEEHFNENYMESEKFPYSEFNGKILENVDFTTNGNYKITLLGWLTIHGVKKEYRVPASISVSNGSISMVSNLKIKLVDHKIEVPSIVFSKIAEQIEIKMESNYKPYKKA